jgi:centromere protein C
MQDLAPGPGAGYSIFTNDRRPSVSNNSNRASSSSRRLPRADVDFDSVPTPPSRVPPKRKSMVNGSVTVPSSVSDEHGGGVDNNAFDDFDQPDISIPEPPSQKASFLRIDQREVDDAINEQDDTPVRPTKKDKGKTVALAPQDSEESPERPQKTNKVKETVAAHEEDEQEDMDDSPVRPKKKGKEREKAPLTEEEQVEMEDEIARGLNDVDLGEHEEDEDEEDEPRNKKVRTEKEKAMALRGRPRKRKSVLEERSRTDCSHFNASVHSYSLSDARRSPTQSTTSISTS